MNKNDLRGRIINIDDFLRQAARELREKTGFERVIFLLPGGRNRVFVPDGLSGRFSVRLTGREFIAIESEFADKKCLLTAALRRGFFGGNIPLIKIKLKLWLGGISAIMPIYYADKFVCLFLFQGRLPGEKRSGLKKIHREITDCLGSVMLYNQAIEGIIKNNCHQAE